MPSLIKHMTLDISIFQFYHYDINKSKIERYNIQLKKKPNKFVLFIYITQCNAEILKILEDFKYIDNFFDYFENIYLICESKTEEEMMKIIKDENLNKYIINKDNNNDEKKVKFIFNLLSYYNCPNRNEKILNIFKDNNSFCPKYFFVLNQDNKIISLEKDINSLIAKISIFIRKLKR